MRKAFRAERKTQKQLKMMVQGLWMETFQLPGNDERFSRLTTLEALEQILLYQAAKEWRADLLKRKRGPYYDDRLPFEPEAEVTTGEEAEAVADIPALDGDPENDEIELAETSGHTDWRDEYEAHLKESNRARV